MARMFLNTVSDLALVIEGGKLKQIHGRPCGACLRVR